eukprot:6186770-Pleurochrysis_carterae.AAC.5
MARRTSLFSELNGPFQLCTSTHAYLVPPQGINMHSSPFSLIPRARVSTKNLPFEHAGRSTRAGVVPPGEWPASAFHPMRRRRALGLTYSSETRLRKIQMRQRAPSQCQPRVRNRSYHALGIGVRISVLRNKYVPVGPEKSNT